MIDLSGKNYILGKLTLKLLFLLREAEIKLHAKYRDSAYILSKNCKLTSPRPEERYFILFFYFLQATVYISIDQCFQDAISVTFAAYCLINGIFHVTNGARDSRLLNLQSNESLISIRFGDGCS